MSAGPTVEAEQRFKNLADQWSELIHAVDALMGELERDPLLRTEQVGIGFIWRVRKAQEALFGAALFFNAAMEYLEHKATLGPGMQARRVQVPQ